MDFKDLKAIADFAIEKEVEAADFYKSVSKEEPMSGVRDMLLEFAGEEMKHKAMLENLEKEGFDKSLSEYRLKWITDIKRSDYVSDLDYKKGMAYNEILMVAMKREEKALKLYNQLLEKVETERAKKLFGILCQEEAAHKLKLETLYDDYMAKMGD
jgi:rubrerythrin